MADRILVLQHGRDARVGRHRQILARPPHAYTAACCRRRARRAARRRRHAPRPPPPLLEVRGLDAGYGARADGKPASGARRLDLTLAPGAVLGVIGESGSRQDHARARPRRPAAAARRHDPARRPGAAAARAATARREHLRRIQIVFQIRRHRAQPRAHVGRILAPPAALLSRPAGAALRRRIAELLDMVRLPRDARRPAARASCPAGRSSASTSPARWPPSPTCSSATRSPRRSTRSSAPRSSTCSPSCGASSASPICSSATT